MNTYRFYFSGLKVRAIGLSLLFSVLCFLNFTNSSLAQVSGGESKVLAKDSLQQNDTFHDPRKAAIKSALLPGLGQVYNKKYWKLPIIYGALGAFSYMAGFNWSQYQLYLNGYKSKFDDDPFNDLFPSLSDRVLEQEYQAYRRNFELSIVGILGVYLLQIVDATVDAHLFYFNVSDDLSMRISPKVLQNPLMAQQPTVGLNLQLNFKR